MFYRFALWLGLVLGGTQVAWASTRDFYQILAVSRQASSAEIKRAYRRLAVLLHPDKHPEDPDKEEQFKELSNAYAALSDPEKRRIYDLHGADFEPEFRRRKNARAVQAARQQASYHQADEFGNRYSNPSWVYEAGGKKFYDNRTRRWSTWSTLWNKFFTEEGYIFYPVDGRYHSVDLGATWQPDDLAGRGWYRGKYDGGVISIDPTTGFATSIKYQPPTVSDASQLFDNLFNPMIYLADKNHQYGNRSELLKKVAELPWTAAQTADFIARAQEHIRILRHPDMQPLFATDMLYFNAFVVTVLDNDKSREHPEIVKNFIRHLQGYASEIVSKLLVRDDWRSHANAAVWYEEAFRYRTTAQALIRASFPVEGAPPELVKAFQVIYPHMKRVGPKAPTIQSLLDYLNIYGQAAFDAFGQELLEIVRTPEFLSLIATVDPNQTHGIDNFMEWYKGVEPEVAKVFLRALAIPGTKKKDYWRLNDAHTKWSMHQAEYDAARHRTALARSQYLQQQLPGFFEGRDDESSRTSTHTVSGCGDLLIRLNLTV